jgi:hypothetical protein
MNKRSTLVFPCIFAAAAAFLVSDAHADTWMMPGQMCQPTSPTQASKISYESALGLRNNDATSALLVTCPFVVPGGEINNLDVAVAYVENHNTSQNLSCTLHLMNELGETVFSSTKSIGGSAGLLNLIWNPLPETFGDNDIVTMNCSVPAYQSSGTTADGKSRIRSYFIHGVD